MERVKVSVTQDYVNKNKAQVHHSLSTEISSKAATEEAAQLRGSVMLYGVSQLWLFYDERNCFCLVFHTAVFLMG
jgi:hypothetical protein